MRSLFPPALVLAIALLATPALAEALPGYITENLGRGSQGDEVRLLQEWLATDTTLYPEGVVNGEYGAATERAVKRYQERKGMVLQTANGAASGMVGPMTRANLNIDFSGTQGGIASVEAKYGDAWMWNGKKFIPLVETIYLADRPVAGRLHVWFYPVHIPEKETPMITVGEYSVGVAAEGYLYAKSSRGTAGAKLTRLVRDEWQHLSVLFTKDDAVFIVDNQVSEVVPLTPRDRFFFSGFFDTLFSPLKNFSFSFLPSKGSAPILISQKETDQGEGVFSGIISFVKNLIGAGETVPQPGTMATEPPAQEVATSTKEAPEPIATLPQLPSKPKTPPLIPELFPPATTTTVTPIASSTLPVGSIPSVSASSTNATSTNSKATTTAQTATSTGSSSTPPAVSLGGSAPAVPANVAPSLALLGSSAVSIPTGSVYTDPGATASDAEDGSLTASIVATGTVNHLIPGDYTISYTVSDSKGLTTSAARVVTVTPPSPLPPEQQTPVYAIPTAGQQVAYSLQSGSAANPNFINVTINPLHVYVGDTQTLTVSVSSPGGVASVVAVTQLDTTTLTLPLAKQSESGDSATFSASWVVYDTHVRTYRTTFTATAHSGATNSTTMAWSDPCSGVTHGTNSTLGADCTVSSIDGLDAGTLTIPSGRTLTINTGGTWAFNPGTSIVVDGVLSKGTGGQIKKGYLFYQECTDCVDTNTRYFFTTEPQTGYVRAKDYSQATYETMYLCFAPETPILMANGTTKALQDVRMGDVVLGEDEHGNRRKNIVTYVYNHGPKEHGMSPTGMRKINGHLLATPEHLIKTARGWVMADELRIGDMLIGVSGAVMVSSIEHASVPEYLYNLTTYPTHTYFAGGVLVHNMKGHCTFC